MITRQESLTREGAPSTLSEGNNTLTNESLLEGADIHESVSSMIEEDKIVLLNNELEDQVDLPRY